MLLLLIKETLSSQTSWSVILSPRSNSTRAGFIFDSKGFGQALDEAVNSDLLLSADKKRIKKILDAAIVGMIQIKKPPAPCNGAWTVSMAAVRNKGMGKIIYDLAYWLSPAGKLVSDRFNLSKQAVSGWFRFSQKNHGEKLDDIENPHNSNEDDDCYLWDSDPAGVIDDFNNRSNAKLPVAAADAVNSSHIKQPEFEWGSLVSHTQTMTKIKLGDETDRSLFFSLTQKVGDEFFSEKYTEVPIVA